MNENFRLTRKLFSFWMFELSLLQSTEQAETSYFYFCSNSSRKTGQNQVDGSTGPRYNFTWLSLYNIIHALVNQRIFCLGQVLSPGDA